MPPRDSQWSRAGSRHPRRHRDYLRNRFLLPTPRMALGKCLRDYASACIDVSDGLLGDAGKLAHASGCGVELSYRALPVSEELVEAVGEERARMLALTGGDDYELCFTVARGPRRAAGRGPAAGALGL